MIVFDLRCIDGGEVFEGWFRSSANYEELSEPGMVQCPFCQSARVEKAPMAPRVRARPRRRRPQKLSWPELAVLQEKLLAGSDWVGDAFAEKARAMHLGEIEQRPVHGRATVEEVRSLGMRACP